MGLECLMALYSDSWISQIHQIQLSLSLLLLPSRARACCQHGASIDTPLV